MRSRGKVIVLLGPPGSGKGTQGALLASFAGIPEISTGEILRNECHSGSQLGVRIQTLLSAGQLVPDDLVNEVAARRLQEQDCQSGCILDGYPRTVSQARFLATQLSNLNLPQPTVLDFAIDCEEVVSRLSRRHQCARCGRIFSIDPHAGSAELICDLDGCELIRRTDDNPDSIRERLRLHQTNSSEIVRFYRHKDYHRISAARSVEEISRELSRLLDFAVLPLARPGSTGVAAFA